MPQPPLAQPLKLPCGAVLPNRIAKAAMTEGLADDQLHATHADPELGIFKAIGAYLKDEMGQARRVKKARR